MKFSGLSQRKPHRGFSTAAASPAYELYAPRNRRLRAMVLGLLGLLAAALHLHRSTDGRFHP